MNKLWKVYCHENKINGKKYFGITSQNINKRWQNGYGYSKNVHFMSSINKYGWDGFNHIVLFDNIKEDECKEIEKYLICKYKTTNSKFGYNLTLGGDGTFGISRKGKLNPRYGKEVSQETRNKIRNSNSGKKYENRTGKNNPISKQVICDGMIFDSILEYSKYYNENIDIVYRWINGTSDLPIKYINLCFNFVENPIDFKEVRENYKKSRRKNNKYKKVKCIDTNKVYEKIIEAEKETNIPTSCIIRCCKGLYKTAGGYKWEYV